MAELSKGTTRRYGRPIKHIEQKSLTTSCLCCSSLSFTFSSCFYRRVYQKLHKSLRYFYAMPRYGLFISVQLSFNWSSWLILVLYWSYCFPKVRSSYGSLAYFFNILISDRNEKTALKSFSISIFCYIKIAQRATYV